MKSLSPENMQEVKKTIKETWERLLSPHSSLSFQVKEQEEIALLAISATVEHMLLTQGYEVTEEDWIQINDFTWSLQTK